MKVLVTGVKGQLGYDVVNELTKCGIEAVGVWGVINLLEGYGNDNPGAKSQSIKNLVSSM